MTNRWLPLRSAGFPLLAALTLAGGVGCKREERSFRISPPSGSRVEGVRLSSLQPGQHLPETRTKNDYEENAMAMSDGKMLYVAFNCVGCHAHGGGGIGPPLLDEKWRYGSDPLQIFASIVEGRPNGMPAFRGKIPDYQVWELVAYVRSLSGLVPKDAAPSREDHMKTNPPPNSVDSVKSQPEQAP